MASSRALLSIGLTMCLQPEGCSAAPSDRWRQGARFRFHNTIEAARAKPQPGRPKDGIPHVEVSRHRVRLSLYLYDCTNKMVLSTKNPLQALRLDEPCRDGWRALNPSSLKV